MRIADFARYVDTIAPKESPPVSAVADLDVEHHRRRSRKPARIVAAVIAAAAVVIVTLLATARGPDRTTTITTDPDITTSTVASTRPGLTLELPGKTTIVIEPAAGAAISPDATRVVHQVGLTMAGYGYDAEIYPTGPAPFDPCGSTQPCREINAPVVNASGLRVHSWAPTLVPGSRPTIPTVFTIDAPNHDFTLALTASFAGAPVPANELVQMVSFSTGSKGHPNFSVTEQGRRYAFAWNGTLVRPVDQSAAADWLVYVTPSCDGADRCELGIGISSLVVPNRDRQPISALVDAVTVEPRP
jgi:hypothetical protein